MPKSTCSVEGCERDRFARGWCQRHYGRWRRLGGPLALSPRRRSPQCSIEGCDRVSDGEGCAQGYCRGHYYRQKRYGRPEAGLPIGYKPGVCPVGGCENPGPLRNGAPGYCAPHLHRLKRYGDPLYVRTPKWVHGTVNGYNADCRCDPCREAQSLAAAIVRRARGVKPRPTATTFEHGTWAGYYHWRCRCDLCREVGLLQSQHGQMIYAARPEVVAAKHRRQLRRVEVAQALLDAKLRHKLKYTPERSRALRAARQKAHPEEKAAAQRRRRARIIGSDSDSHTLADVIALDGWICGLCRKRVDPNLRFPNPGSKTEDHIVPISRGGSHTLANAQLAHLGCNSAKCDRVGIASQLRLPG